MSKPNRRYVFIDFDNLKKVKFKKLEKVCDKVFVFINKNEEQIPFSLVQQMQGMGKSLKWIAVANPRDNDMNYHICFLMGRLHQRVNKDIEFAILSNDDALDSLVDFINRKGRSCLRVKRKSNKKEGIIDTKMGMNGQDVEEHSPTIIKKIPKIEKSPKEKKTTKAAVTGHRSEAYEEIKTLIAESPVDHSLIDETARETVKRLIRSGNRPVELEMLKNYILLHNQELTLHGNVDQVIERLENTKEIKVEEGEVVYNF